MSNVQENKNGMEESLQKFAEQSGMYLLHLIEVWEWFYQGSYPRPHQEKIDIKLWYRFYLRTYSVL